MSFISRRLVVGVSVTALALVPVAQVVASSQSTLKVRIVAPECTIDTIDDGSGPIQIITCPPGVIDPKPPTDDNDGKDTVPDDDIDDVEVQPTTNPQISQRLQSSVRPRALVNSLRDSGITVEPPHDSAKVRKPDVQPVTKTDTIPPVVQGLLIAAVVVAGAMAIPSKNARLSRMRNKLLRRK